MQTTTPVTIKDGAVCGAIRQQDSLAGGPERERPGGAGRQGGTDPGRVSPACWRAIIGHEICTTYAPDGTGFIAKASHGRQAAACARPEGDLGVAGGRLHRRTLTGPFLVEGGERARQQGAALKDLR